MNPVAEDCWISPKSNKSRQQSDNKKLRKWLFKPETSSIGEASKASANT